MSFLSRVAPRLQAARARWAGVDHAVRAYDRHSAVLGGQIAAAITYFGFLSFFPLLALAFSVVGYVSVVYPDARDDITAAVQSAFPSLIGSGAGQIDIDDVADAKAGAGIIGLAGLLYAGLGWVDSLRDGLRIVFGTLDDSPPLLRKKLLDLVVLVLLGLAVLGSIVVSSLATAATALVLGWVGLAGSLVATALLKVLAVMLALAFDTAVLAILLTRLTGATMSWRQVGTGAVLGAVGFEVLKLLGTFLIGRTTDNSAYAAVGVVVGLLVWINLVSRLFVYTAAWTATRPYSLVPATFGQPGAGRETPLGRASDPILLEPSGYPAVPAVSEAEASGADAADASVVGAAGRTRSRTRTVRGALIGAALGAWAGNLVARRRSRA